MGDSGYRLKSHLLTPFKDRGQLTNRQNHYNVQLAKNRYIIEHCFSVLVLKQKFRTLYHIKLRKIQYNEHLIRAACVLHNIALADEVDVNFNPVDIVGDVLPEYIANIDEDDGDDEQMEMDIDARRIKDIVVNSF